jgi:hypothetical protein
MCDIPQTPEEVFPLPLKLVRTLSEHHWNYADSYLLENNLAECIAGKHHDNSWKFISKNDRGSITHLTYYKGVQVRATPK